MTETGSNRVVIIDKAKKATRMRTDAELVQENEQIRQLLGQRREAVTQEKDELKEAIRDDDLQALLARKKAEKEAATKAKEEHLVEVPPTEEIVPEPPINPVKEKNVVSSQKHVSLNMGVVGIGQAGSKLAKVFYDLGYDVCVANTAKQDLELLDIPDNQKFFMDYSGVGGGGAGRELSIGKAAIERDYNDVKAFVDEHTGRSDVLVLCIAGGGGCISEDSSIYTTRGMETIAELFTAMQDKYDVQEDVSGQLFIDIRDENIFTYSLKPSGEIIKNRINEIWFNGTKDEYVRVSTFTGTFEVTPNHPFFVFNGQGIIEKAAKDLTTSDRLIGLGDTVLNAPLTEEEQDPRLAWLMGVILGGGHIHKSGMRFDITAEPSVVGEVESIMQELYGIKKSSYIGVLNSALAYSWNNKEMVTRLCNWLELSPGAKTKKIKFPKAILRSGADSIGAFIAGLIDSDGFVFPEKCQLKYSTISKQMAEELMQVLNVFGCNAYIRKEAPYGKARNDLFNVLICGHANMDFIFKHVMPNMHSVHKKERLEKYSTSTQRSFHHSKVFISKDEMLDNYVPKMTFDGKRFWHNQEFLTKSSFAELVACANISETNVGRIFDKIQPITSIENIKEEKEFYDLSMDSNINNYMAGKGDFSFIHNTGSGAASTAVELLNEIGKPVIVIYVLPGSADDSQSKHNAIETLAELGGLAANAQINSLILVDNAKIELAYPELSQAAFWKTANKAIVTPLHMFNSVTARPTDYEALDSMDFAKSLLEAGNCVLFGSTSISADVYEDDETAIVEAIIDDLERGLLASGFNLNEAQTVGILITAKQSVLETIPYRALSYAFKYMTTEYDSARTFKGVYAIPSDNDDITVHFIFSGMGLPEERVKSLQTEAKTHMDNLTNKMKMSKEKMTIDLGKDRTSAKADEVMEKIRRKKNPLNKLIKGERKGVVDRRR